MQRIYGVYKNIILISGSLILLGITGVIDYLTGIDYSFILLYLGLIILVGTYIGGAYSYFYAGICGLIRSQFALMLDHPFTTFQIALIFINIIGGFCLLNYYVLPKNRILCDLENLSLTDALTKLPNLRAFRMRLSTALAHSHRHKEHLSIAYIDVDGFKAVNDTHGHHKGDELLKLISYTIMRNMRADDTAARLGGDEFALIFLHKPDNSMAMIYRLKQDLDIACKKNPAFNVSFSIGVVNYDGFPKVTEEEILMCADQLMYKVKTTSKNAILIENFKETVTH